MIRAVATVAAVIVLAAGVVVLREATQNRPDPDKPGSSSTVEYVVTTRRYYRGEAAAALALWSVCSPVVSGARFDGPTSTGGSWKVTLTPALGANGRKRLVGCLEDLSVERVQGDVIAIRSPA